MTLVASIDAHPGGGKLTGSLADVREQSPVVGRLKRSCCPYLALRWELPSILARELGQTASWADTALPLPDTGGHFLRCELWQPGGWDDRRAVCVNELGGEEIFRGRIRGHRD
jgi:hypothetical protein